MAFRKTKDRLEYFVACVTEFADAFGLDYQKSFDYLDRHCGLDFLMKCYEAEHTVSFADAVNDLLNLRRFAPTVNEEFARFVMANRQARTTATDHNRDNRYDIVTGPIADDRMGVLFRRFEDGEVSLEYLINELKFKRLSMQYSFHTKRSLLKLTLKEVRRV